MSEVLVIMGSYLLLAFIIVAFMGFMLSGFMVPYLRVKASRGKKVLVKVKTLTSDYYRVGTIDEELLTFKDKQKETRTINIIKGAISRGLNVNNIEVNDVGNSVIMPHTKEVVPGYDAVKISNYIVRALTRPELTDNKTKIIIILCGVILLGLIILIFMTIDTKTAIEKLGEIAGGTVTPATGV